MSKVVSAGSQFELKVYGTTMHDDGSNQSTQLFMNHDGLVDTHLCLSYFITASKDLQLPKNKRKQT